MAYDVTPFGSYSSQVTSRVATVWSKTPKSRVTSNGYLIYLVVSSVALAAWVVYSADPAGSMTSQSVCAIVLNCLRPNLSCCIWGASSGLQVTQVWRFGRLHLGFRPLKCRPGRGYTVNRDRILCFWGSCAHLNLKWPLSCFTGFETSSVASKLTGHLAIIVLCSYSGA